MSLSVGDMHFEGRSGAQVHARRLVPAPGEVRDAVGLRDLEWPGALDPPGKALDVHPYVYYM